MYVHNRVYASNPYPKTQDRRSEHARVEAFASCQEHTRLVGNGTLPNAIPSVYVCSEHETSKMRLQRGETDMHEKERANRSPGRGLGVGGETPTRVRWGAYLLRTIYIGR